MILHWLFTAWRSLIANPLFSLITIASLSIGCCGAVLAGSNIVQHLSFERWVPDAQNIAKVTLLVKGDLGEHAMRGGGEQTDGVFAARLMAPSLFPAVEGGRFPQIKASTRVYDGYLPLKDFPQDKQAKVISVEPNFFDVFEFPVASGNARDALKEPDQVILTESFARRLFGTADAVGKSMPLRTTDPNGNRPIPPMLVGAVLRDLPAATHFNFEAMVGPGRARAINMSGMGFTPQDVRSDTDLRNRSESCCVVFIGSQYVRFAPGFDFERDAPFMQDAFTRIVQTADGLIPHGAEIAEVDKVTLIPLLGLHLAGPQNTGLRSSGDMLLLVTLGGAAFALLSVSTFNYVILSLASSLRRRKEVAVRKVLGAGKGALVQHYLAEAALVAGLSLALGFAAAELLQPWFARAIAQPDVLVNIYDRWFLGIGGAALIVLVLSAGFYPAFYLAGVRPREGLENSNGDNLGLIGRSVTGALLGLQVAAASVLLTLAITMAAQIRFVTQQPLGYSVENMYRMLNACVRAIPMPGGGNAYANDGGPELAQCRARRVADLRALPGVDAASSFDGTIADPDVVATMEFGLPGAQAMLGQASRLQVDTDFLQMVGAKLLAGRFFDSSSAYDRRLVDSWPPDPSIGSVPIVVTRAILPMLGVQAPEDAIGKSIQPKGFPIPLEIVGVVEDWRQRSLRHKIEPVIFFPGADALSPIVSIKPENLATVTERVRAVPPLARPGMPPLVLIPLANVFERAYAGDRRLMFAVLGFAGVAMLVACLGVFGLSAFDMRRRVREIGIRKALGATPAKVAGMVLGRQVLFAAIASLASWPVGLWLSNSWLQQYAYRTELGLLALPLASLIVIAFAALAVGLNTARAAAIRPSFALRTAT